MVRKRVKISKEMKKGITESTICQILLCKGLFFLLEVNCIEQETIGSEGSNTAGNWGVG